MSKLLHKSHILLLLSGICLCLFVAISAYYIVFFHVSPLSRDQWQQYEPYFEHGLLSAALTPMSGVHRYIFPFLLFDIDMSYFNGNNSFLVFFGSLMDGLLIILLLYSIRLDHLLSQNERRAFSVLCIGLLLWLVNMAQLGWGFMSTQYYLAIFSCVFAVYAAWQSCYRLPGAAKICGAWLSISLISGTIATFSFGMGILVWPSLLWFAWMWRAPARFTVAVSLGFVFCLSLFFLLPGRESIEGSLIFLPASTFHFLFQLPAGPLYYLMRSYRVVEADTIKPFASMIGMLVTTIGALLFIRMTLQRQRLSLFMNLCAALMMLGWGSAVLISVARLPFFLDVWVDRFQIWAILFWLGFLPLCYSQFNQTFVFKKYLQTPFLCALFLFPLFALPSQLDMGARLSEYKIRVQQALLTYQAGVPDKNAAEEALHWNWENKLTSFFTVLHYLKDQKKNIYCIDYTDALGFPLSNLNIQHLEPVTSLKINKIDSILREDLLDIKNIPGSELFKAFDAPESTNIVAYQISGNVIASTQWTHAVIANESGKVIGLGIAIDHSKLPRSQFKYVNGNYNFFAVVRNDNAEKLRFYFLNGKDVSTALVSEEVSISVK